MTNPNPKPPWHVDYFGDDPSFTTDKLHQLLSATMVYEDSTLVDHKDRMLFQAIHWIARLKDQMDGLQQQNEQLKQKLKRFIPNPVVTVSVLNSVSNKIYVVGKVNRPGEYKATHYMDDLQALSLAGGLTPFAESDEIKIIRRSNGINEIYNFDYDEVINGKKLEMNIILKAGDTVAVP